MQKRNEDPEEAINNEIIIEQQEFETPVQNMEEHEESIPISEPAVDISIVNDCGVQVNADDIYVPFSARLTTDAHLSTLTGIEFFQILDPIVEIVKTMYGDKFERADLVMKTRERIIMVYTKMKQNLSYSLLAIMFDCHSAQHCKRIFCEMIKVLSAVLKDLIRWPTKTEILKNVPTCFKRFENVRVILDCTEIFIEKPKEVCCQLISYSHYKSGLTGKFLTGVAPSGMITFVSKLYGGRVSDTCIFS